MPGRSTGILMSCASTCWRGISNGKPELAIFVRAFASIAVEMSLPNNISGAVRALRFACAFIDNHHSLSNPCIRSNAKRRLIPGGIPAIICAASIRIVPEPHIGSSNGIPGFQPVIRSNPAARFSRSGASPVSVRHPRLNKASPEVSRYKVTLWASRKADIRISGLWVSTFGRSCRRLRKRSTIASFTRSVAKFKLLSGDLMAATSIRIVLLTSNHCSHGCLTANL